MAENVIPTPGRIVHFVTEHGPFVGECRPGIVVRLQDPANGIIRVRVFCDPIRDGYALQQLPDQVLSVPYGADGKNGTWHWPQACEVKP